jgi:hypothetical protein
MRMTVRLLPFCGPESIEAMKATQRGELRTVGPPDKLLASLNADC